MRTRSTRGLRIISTVLLCLATVLLPGRADTGAVFSGDSETSLTASAFEHMFVLRNADWWLDSTDASTLFSDAACTTPAGTTSGSTVRCWTDKRTSTDALTTTGAGATIAPLSIGTETPLRFGSGSLLDGPDLLGGSVTDLNIFVVLRENTRTKNILFNLNGTSLVARVSTHAPWDDNRWYVDLGNTTTNRSNSSAGITAVGDEVLLVAWKDSTVGKVGFRVNSSSDFLSSTSTAATTTGGLAIGDSTVPFVSHDIAEIIIYSERLSAADELEVTQYLETKWGL